MQKRTENQITALYCRLSQDDGVDMESNSIQNQRKILQEYIDKNRIRNTMFFADDGYSGTDFNRPDFQRMEAMVERGEIGTIIVKDLSRFARNTTVANILHNQQYTGCAINFKTTTISYKVHERIRKPKEEWLIIPNAQEPIIDEETFQRVQEIREHRKRRTSTGKKSILTPKMFCGDCGSKLYYHAGRNVRDGSEYFRCSQYKTNRSLCSTNHYVRDSVMRELVTETIRKVAEYVTKFEPVFLYLYAKKNSEVTARNMRTTRSRVEKAKKRIAELNTLIMKVYEDHVLGSLSEERYNMMAESYENEQNTLKQQLDTDEATLSKAEQSTSDLITFLKAIRQFTEIEAIDEKTINTLISKIEVFERVKVDGKLHLPVKIHFTAVGIIDVPTEKEILRVMEEIRNNSKPQKTA